MIEAMGATQMSPTRRGRVASPISTAFLAPCHLHPTAPRQKQTEGWEPWLMLGLWHCGVERHGKGDEDCAFGGFTFSPLHETFKSKKTQHQLQKLFPLPTLVLSAYRHLSFPLRHEGEKRMFWREDKSKINEQTYLQNPTKKGTHPLPQAKAALGDKPTEHYPSFYSTKHALPTAISHPPWTLSPALILYFKYFCLSSILQPETLCITYTAFLTWT